MNVKVTVASQSPKQGSIININSDNKDIKDCEEEEEEEGQSSNSDDDDDDNEDDEDDMNSESDSKINIHPQNNPTPHN